MDINTQKKTDIESRIPVLPALEKLIDKYRWHPLCQERKLLFPVLSNQKMNAYLKEIAIICGIRKNLTSHVARHTFATTITLNNDIPFESVSKMLGHTNMQTTRIYAKVLDKKVGREMSKLNQIYA